MILRNTFLFINDFKCFVLSSRNPIPASLFIGLLLTSWRRREDSIIARLRLFFSLCWWDTRHCGNLHKGRVFKGKECVPLSATEQHIAQTMSLKLLQLRHSAFGQSVSHYRLSPPGMLCELSYLISIIRRYYYYLEPIKKNKPLDHLSAVFKILGSLSSWKLDLCRISFILSIDGKNAKWK